MSAEKTPLKNVHIVMQGKGGAGKTITSVMLSQTLAEKYKTECFDTDPVNASFSQYSELNPKRVNITDNKYRIIPRRFDELIEDIINSDAEHLVIDTGSQSFLELTGYLVDSEVLSLLKSLDMNVLIHVPVTAGPGQLDTFNGLQSVLNAFPVSVQIVVWMNEFFGSLTSENNRFARTNVYKMNKDRIKAAICLSKENPGTTELDVADMLTRRETFDQAIKGKNTFVMAKHRLAVVKDKITAQVHDAIA